MMPAHMPEVEHTLGTGWWTRIQVRLPGLTGTATRRRLARGAFWGGVGFALARGVTLAVSFVLARLLGQAGFGEYSMVNSTAGMIGGMAGLGLGMTVMKHTAEFKSSDPAKASRILALSSAITWVSAIVYAGFLIVLAPWMATRLLAAPQLAPLLQISAITVAFGVINSVQTCSLTGCEAFRTNMFVGVSCSLWQSFLLMAGAWKWGLVGAVGGLAAGALTTVLITRWAVAREWRLLHLRLGWQDAWKEWRVLFEFSLPSFLSGMLLGPVLWACNAMLANQEDGYLQLGIFNAANQWQQAIQFLPGLLGTALLPILSEKCGQGDWRKSLVVMRKMMLIYAAIVLPLAALLSICSPWIMRGYGESFLSGYWALVFSVQTAAIFAIFVPTGQFLAASGRMWIGFCMNIGWAVAMLLASWWMVRWGAEGLAAARMIAYLCHALWTLGYLYFLEQRGKKAVDSNVSL